MPARTVLQLNMCIEVILRAANLRVLDHGKTRRYCFRITWLFAQKYLQAILQRKHYRYSEGEEDFLANLIDPHKLLAQRYEEVASLMKNSLLPNLK